MPDARGTFGETPRVPILKTVGSEIVSGHVTWDWQNADASEIRVISVELKVHGARLEATV